MTSDMTDPSGGEASPWIERVRSLHGLWVVAEAEGEMPGAGAATRPITGDARKGRID